MALLCALPQHLPHTTCTTTYHHLPPQKGRRLALLRLLRGFSLSFICCAFSLCVPHQVFQLHSSGGWSRADRSCQERMHTRVDDVFRWDGRVDDILTHTHTLPSIHSHSLKLLLPPSHHFWRREETGGEERGRWAGRGRQASGRGWGLDLLSLDFFLPIWLPGEVLSSLPAPFP